LYDVFINIRDDEGEHVKTMAACQDFSIMADLEVRRESERRI
jgi:ubiquinol oxidase